MEDARREIQQAERARLVESADTDLKTYENDFKKVETAKDERNRLVYDVLDVKGPFMEKNLSAILESANKDNKTQISFSTAISLKHLLLARLYVTKFLDTNAKKVMRTGS